MIVFDLTDDDDNVSITNIAVSSLVRTDLPKFLFLGEDKGHFYLYTRVPVRENGATTTIKEHIPETALTRSIIARLLEARDKYLEGKRH